MADETTNETTNETTSKLFGLVAKKRLLAEFVHTEADTSLEQHMSQLGIPEQERSQSVSLAISVLLERIDDMNRELTNAQEEFDQLEQLVDVDTLVPVPNRRAFHRRLNWAISMFKRYGHPCSLCYFDLNKFKAINDEYGHSAGDEVIRSVAQLLTDSMRASDFMARLGGDEFVVLFYHAKQDVARKRASLIAKRIEDHLFMWKNVRLPVSASFGTYEIKGTDTAEAALSHADEAMYRHKKAQYQN